MFSQDCVSLQRTELLMLQQVEEVVLGVLVLTVRILPCPQEGVHPVQSFQSFKVVRSQPEPEPELLAHIFSFTETSPAEVTAAEAV